MGFNTAVLVLNDHIHEIEKNAEFGSELSAHIRAVTSRPKDWNYAAGFSALPSQHADYDQVVVIGGNRIQAFHDMGPVEALALVKEMARKIGYRVSKK